MSPGRYAVYYAPAQESPWWSFAAHWVGRDEFSGRPLPQTCPTGFEADGFAGLTAEPRRYGFHATLRPPMRLDATEAAFLQRLEDLAAQLRAVPLGTLVPVYMDGFVALVPSARNPMLGTLAARLVTGLEPLRAPLNDAERARRKPDQLDPRGRELVDQYGYPGVMERFRFHMTLTGAVDTATAGRLVAHLAAPVARLNQETPPVLDRLCVFHEPEPGAPFRRMRDLALRS